MKVPSEPFACSSYQSTFMFQGFLIHFYLVCKKIEVGIMFVLLNRAISTTSRINVPYTDSTIISFTNAEIHASSLACGRGLLYCMSVDSVTALNFST